MLCFHLLRDNIGSNVDFLLCQQLYEADEDEQMTHWLLYSRIFTKRYLHFLLAPSEGGVA